MTFVAIDTAIFSCPQAPFELFIEILSDDILRLRIGNPSASYLPSERQQELAVSAENATQTSIKTNKLALRSRSDESGIEFCDCSGRARLALEFAGVSTRPRLQLRFELLDEQHFYGLGHGGQPFDRLGATRRLSNCHVNHGPGADIAIPLLLSSSGFGLFFDQPKLATVNPGRSYDVICLEYECDETALDLYFLGGRTMRETLGSVARLLGNAPMPPRWALGYLQSTRDFENRAEVLQLADTLRQKQLPCDAIVFLSSYGEALGWNLGVGHLDYQERLFTEPRALISALHQQGLHVVSHEYPVLHRRSRHYAEAEQKGYLLKEAYHQDLSEEPSSTDYHQGQPYIDFFRPEVGAWWWRNHRHLVDDGVDGWWLDGGEGPFQTSASTPSENWRNCYDLLRLQAFAEGEAAGRPQKRPFFLCRSGGPGMQRFGAACWSGDINNTFATLEAQPALGLNTGLSGVPYWGTDVGGYYASAPQTAELFVRWLQFGCFCPIFRGHGRNWRMHLPWAYGPEVEAICRRVLELRYQLMPYTYTLAFTAHCEGLPLMRPLVLNYPNDPQVWEMATQYLWGDDLLVAPVTRGGADHWPVYLPAGNWYDFWTSEAFHGPVAIEVAAPLERLPLFVRAGAIIPLGPITQHAKPGVLNELQLLVYPEGQTSSTLYDDDGESNAYLTGSFALTKFECIETTGEIFLRIALPVGADTIVPPDRRYRFQVYTRQRPRTVENVISGERVAMSEWSYFAPFATFVVTGSPAEIRVQC
jgi:alpha-glucosidase (family GH31 glycosyl hydrolase)